MWANYKVEDELQQHLFSSQVGLADFSKTPLFQSSQDGDHDLSPQYICQTYSDTKLLESKDCKFKKGRDRSLLAANKPNSIEFSGCPVIYHVNEWYYKVCF